MFKPLKSLLHWRDGSRSYLVNRYNPYVTGGMDHDPTLWTVTMHRDWAMICVWTVRIQMGWDIISVSAVPPVFVRSPWCSTVTEAVLVWWQRVIDVMKMDIETYEWNVTRNMLDSGALKWVSFFLSPPPPVPLPRPTCPSGLVRTAVPLCWKSTAIKCSFF